MTGLLLRGAELDGRTGVDVRVEDGHVVEVGTALGRRPGEAWYDCRGGALLPGLCDHHLHLHALAAWGTSVRCGPPEVTGPAALAAALAAAVPDEHGWIRGVGYAETVAGDLDATALDRLRPDRPVRVQHRSGALWTLNTAAMAATGLAGADHPGVERDDRGLPTGRLWRADGWLRSRLPPAGPPDLAPVGAALTRFGITAVTDATPDLDVGAVAAITEAMRGGALPQRVQLLGAPLDTPAGHGDPVGPPCPAVGPYKIVIADSGLPTLDELTGRIRAAHAAGRAVAVHCVTREALVLLLVALDDAGSLPGDRVEHAALVPAELAPEMARLGLRVVTQPGFLAHRGDDFLRDLPTQDHQDLYRCATFFRAGVPVALSSDAPYGPLDPWAVIGAAIRRHTPAGRVAGPGERLTFSQALDAYLAPPGDPGGPARRVRRGTPADLVVLRTRLADAPADPEPVRAVLVGGHLVWDRLGAGAAGG
ncbi:amidohydrolase family protein [Streptosporangium sp. NPDC002607]